MAGVLILVFTFSEYTSSDTSVTNSILICQSKQLSWTIEVDLEVNNDKNKIFDLIYQAVTSFVKKTRTTAKSQ